MNWGRWTTISSGWPKLWNTWINIISAVSMAVGGFYNSINWNALKKKQGFLWNQFLGVTMGIEVWAEAGVYLLEDAAFLASLDKPSYVTCHSWPPEAIFQQWESLRGPWVASAHGGVNWEDQWSTARSENIGNPVWGGHPGRGLTLVSASWSSRDHWMELMIRKEGTMGYGV